MSHTYVMMRRALEKLDEWCTEWAVRVNVDKCGIMQEERCEEVSAKICLISMQYICIIYVSIRTCKCIH